MTEQPEHTVRTPDVRVYQRMNGVKTLGPGNRYCLWVQGCPRACPGCASPNSRSPEGGYPMSPGALAAEISLYRPEGITISGGEPFEQSRSLGAMLDMLKRLYRCDPGVIVYTGYLYEELAALPDAGLLLDHTDLLIDGPYIRELNDGGSLRGSSNQRIIPLTGRYDSPGILSLYGCPGRKSETRSAGGSVLTIGIPEKKKDS